MGAGVAGGPPRPAVELARPRQSSGLPTLVTIFFVSDGIMILILYAFFKEAAVPGGRLW